MSGLDPRPASIPRSNPTLSLYLSLPTEGAFVIFGSLQRERSQFAWETDVVSSGLIKYSEMPSPRHAYSQKNVRDISNARIQASIEAGLREN